MFKYTSPVPFDFTNGRNCYGDSKDFEKHRNSGIEENKTQASKLMYCMGSEAENIIRIYFLTRREDSNVNDSVLEKLNNFFMPKRNVIHERQHFILEFIYQEIS